MLHYEANKDFGHFQQLVISNLRFIVNRNFRISTFPDVAALSSVKGLKLKGVV